MEDKYQEQSSWQRWISPTSAISPVMSKESQGDHPTRDFRTKGLVTDSIVDMSITQSDTIPNESPTEPVQYAAKARQRDVASIEPMMSWQRIKHAWRAFYLSWWWEFTGMAFSLCAFTAALILLGTLQGKPLSSWAFPIAPNSLLSVFVTLSKTALLLVVSGCIGQLKWLFFHNGEHRMTDLQVFEEASRGPLGSLGFFFRLSPRDLFRKSESGASLAAIGTFIMIGALAVDPFAQQVLKYPLQQTNTTADFNTIPTTQIYDNGDALMEVWYDCAGKSLFARIRSSTFSKACALTHMSPSTWWLLRKSRRPR